MALADFVDALFARILCASPFLIGTALFAYWTWNRSDRLEEVIVYQRFKRFSPVIAFSTPILALLYLVLFPYRVLRDAFPLPLFLQVKAFLTPAVAIGFLIYFPALIVACLFISKSKPHILRFIVLLVGLAVGIYFYPVLSIRALTLPEAISSSAHLNNQNYYVTNEGEFGDMWTTYWLFQCNEKDLECVELYRFGVGGSWIRPIALVVDQSTKEVHVYMGGDGDFHSLVYSYGAQPREYKFEDLAALGTDDHHLYSYAGHSGFVLTRCDQEGLSQCQVFPLSYTSPSIEGANLIADITANELLILFGGEVFLTYDNESREYRTLKTIEAASWLCPDTPTACPRRFSLSSYEEGGMYKYILHECRLDYVACALIPFRYSTLSQENADLVAIKGTNDLDVYIGGQRIYTYGAHPTCHVKGCSTPEQ